MPPSLPNTVLDLASAKLPHRLDLADRRQLLSAFDVFNQVSEQLASSYQAMEMQIGQLTAELSRVAAERLQELEAKERVSHRLESLLNLLPAGVVVLDHRGVVSQCNPAATELLGEPLTGERWRDVIARSFAPRSDDGHEISLRDGRRISIATRSLDGEPGQLLLLTDLTETRLLQQRLSRHQRLSEMGRMVSSLAHQIRTPLSAAMLYADHLCHSDLDAAQRRRFAEKIASRLNHLEQQVKDMLIFVKGEVRLSDSVSVDELVAGLRQAMEVPLAASGSCCRIDNRCPGLGIHCNRESVVGAVMNLINNAVQAVGRGAVIVLTCEVVADALQITVTDNGPGFDSATKANIGEPFFTTKPQGTGLGLAVVRAVAQAHGGEFAIDAEPGVGARAVLRLPLAKSTVESAHEQNP